LKTEDEERSGRPTGVTVPESVNVIHSMILDDLRMSSKRLAETLAISPRKNRPRDSRDFRHVKIPSQMGSLISQC
jgi:hypothetical protein